MLIVLRCFFFLFRLLLLLIFIFFRGLVSFLVSQVNDHRGGHCLVALLFLTVLGQDGCRDTLGYGFAMRRAVARDVISLREITQWSQPLRILGYELIEFPAPALQFDERLIISYLVMNLEQGLS